MASHHVEINLDERYQLDGKSRQRFILTIAIGLIMTVIGIIGLAMGWGTEGHDSHAATGTHASQPHTAKSQDIHGGQTQGTQGKNEGGQVVNPDEHSKADAHGTAPATTSQSGDIAVHANPSDADQGGAAGHDPHPGEITDAPANDPGASNTHGAHAEGHEAGHGEGHGDAHGGGHEAPGWMARVWANLWLNGVFFTGLALIGVFFVAVQYVAYAGWSTGIKRVPIAFGAFLPIGGLVLLVTFLLGKHDLFHWTHDYLYDKNSPEYDAILDSKTWYLNLPFYLGRMIVFLGAWFFFYRLIRGYMLKEDSESGVTGKWWGKATYWSAAFIVLFAVSTSMVAWDWVMSIDAHWYSTLFGWYTFASWWVSGLATITLAVLLLKERGLMPYVNDNHLHDLGKFMFAFSVFWTYLWFSQFMLIYYANIPEEIVYYRERWTSYDGKYSGLWFLNFFINFLFPFLFLMTRESKRLKIFLKIAAIGILAGHWLDFYLAIMPGVTKGTSGFGLVEFGMLITFVGLFRLVVATTLSKAPLVAKNHPMLEESMHHHI